MIRTLVLPPMPVDYNVVLFIVVPDLDPYAGDLVQEAYEAAIRNTGLQAGDGWLSRMVQFRHADVTITMRAHDSPRARHEEGDTGEYVLWRSPAARVRFDTVTGWPSEILDLFGSGPWEVGLKVTAATTLLGDPEQWVIDFWPAPRHASTPSGPEGTSRSPDGA